MKNTFLSAFTLSGKKKFLVTLAGLLSAALSTGNPKLIALIVVLYLVVEYSIDSKRAWKDVQTALAYSNERLIGFGKEIEAASNSKDKTVPGTSTTFAEPLNA